MEISLLLPLALLALMMVFMWRSNKKRTQQQNEMRAKIQPGAEVMTQAGIYGTLVTIDEADNIATLETTPGVLIRVHSSAIAHVVEPTIAVPDDASALTNDVDNAGQAINDAEADNGDGENSNDDRPKA